MIYWLRRRHPNQRLVIHGAELETQKLIEFALDAVWQAGRITLGYFQSDLNVERKADNSPLTLADQQAEQKLRALIGAAWPQHGIIGEEYGEKKGSSGYSWVIDPIDGTKSFVAGVPLYATLLALTDGEKSILGVAHFRRWEKHCMPCAAGVVIGTAVARASHRLISSKTPSC